MLMEDCVMCKHCKKTSSVALHAQTTLCHGCGKIIIVGRNRKTALSITNIESTWEQGRVISDTKCPQNPFRMRWSGHEGASSSTKAELEQCDTINSWEAPQGKRALLCGVTYRNQKFRLKGTINDVNNMRNLLVEHYNFPRSSIHILTEGGHHFPPTRKNIQAGLKWLVKDCKAGDSLVFFFSGHGLRQPNFDDDELDGFDETICPLDFKTAGLIIDNEINETIVRPLKPGVRLHAIVDACHSGTILDLPHFYSMKDKRWIDNHPPSGVYKGTSGGEAICFSACEDDQFAEDTSAFSGKQMAGAMTYNFIKAIKENPKITYGGLLISMHTAIKEGKETGCLNLKKLFRRKILQVSPSPVYGKKRAVICGVSYLGQKSSLKGSVNDAISMRKFLLNMMGFPNASVLVLTEEETDMSRIPTRRNIEMALRWLVEGCQSGDSLVFYYSGHASRREDLSGDEMDGYDELLCPVDYKTAGKISDDEINATIVHPLPRGAKLHAITDTCFSGTMVDLPFVCRMNWQGQVWEDHRVQYGAYKGTSGGLAISISACDDHQNSGDTTAFTGDSVGALTYSFIHSVENEPNLTYGSLLNSMRNKISEAQQRLGEPPQVPQLSSTEKFDVFSRRFIL